MTRGFLNWSLDKYPGNDQFSGTLRHLFLTFYKNLMQNNGFNLLLFSVLQFCLVPYPRPGDKTVNSVYFLLRFVKNLKIKLCTQNNLANSQVKN